MKKKRLKLLNLLLVCGVFTLSNISEAAVYIESLDSMEIEIQIKKLENNPKTPSEKSDNPFYAVTQGYVS